jgi:hypothetical protein
MRFEFKIAPVPVQMKVEDEVDVFVNVAYQAAMISFLREFKGLSENDKELIFKFFVKVLDFGVLEAVLLKHGLSEEQAKRVLTVVARWL